MNRWLPRDVRFLDEVERHAGDIVEAATGLHVLIVDFSDLTSASCAAWVCRRSAALLGKLDAIEERLASWLDRFDVFEQGPRPVLQEFFARLKHIDGALALQNLFLGRQRPHHRRLSQALRRLDPD